MCPKSILFVLQLFVSYEIISLISSMLRVYLRYQLLHHWQQIWLWSSYFLHDSLQKDTRTPLYEIAGKE